MGVSLCNAWSIFVLVDRDRHGGLMRHRLDYIEMDATSVIALSAAIDHAVPSALHDAVAVIQRLNAALVSARQELDEVAENHLDTLALLAAEMERNMQRYQGVDEALRAAGSHSQVLVGVLNAVARP